METQTQDTTATTDSKAPFDRLDGARGHSLQRTKDLHDQVVTADLSFQLTTEDYAEKGKQAGRVAAELRDLEEEFDELKKDWKVKIEAKENELTDIHRTIRAGKETRRVKCIERKDFNSNRLTHLFNGEVLAERALELHERQMSLVQSAPEVADSARS